MRHIHKWALFAGALAVNSALSPLPPTYGQSAGDEIVVIDGDTLEINGAIVRLYGIDAPELGQTCLDTGKRWRCGLQAALELRGQLSRWKGIECSTDLAGGAQAICHDSNFSDPAEILLARGLAVALPQSIPAYKRAENEARRAKLGIWRGEFVDPAEWRKGKRLTGSADGPAEVCDIKGVVTASGNRVYYVPTDSNYKAIEISADRGERTFCSDDEAELAGWKRYPRK